MFQRLWVRLSVAFAALMAVFAVVVLALFLFFSDNRNLIRQSLIATIKDSAIPARLVSLYEQSGNWTSVIAWLRDIEADVLLIQDAPTPLILADASGHILYGSPAPSVQTLTQEQIDEAVVLARDDTVIGYIDVDISAWRPSTSARALFIDQMRHTTTVILIVASIFGMVVGVIISRLLTAPLEQLAAWATHVRERRMEEPFQLDGSVEITMLVGAINDMVAALRESEVLRRSLVADVAHELRTPLTVLQGNLYAVLDDVYPCDKAQVTQLYDQTRVLSRLVNDLHDLALVEANQSLMEMRPVQIDALIRDAVEQFQFQAEQKAIQLHYMISGPLPAVQGDAERLYQVLNNLLSNALRHSPDGERVIIEGQTEADTVIITVINSGAEIPTAHLPHIFERFYRVDRARERNKGGAGLGLAIARAIVEAHNGTISASSGDGHTRLVVCLPVMVVQPTGTT